MVIYMDIVQEINKLKKELNAVILAHNYQSPEVQEVADFVGDSLELSIKSLETKAKYIVFAGVDFMAEQAAVLNEEAVVLHPEPDARCPMASKILVDDIIRVRKMYPDAPVVIYVNSPAIVKAYADYVVTSANAVKLVASLNVDKIVFGPDPNLGDYIARKTGKIVIPLREDSYCPVHVKFNSYQIRELKKIYGGKFIAHPECSEEIRVLADFVGSTSQMIKYVRECNNCKTIIVGTEIGIIYRMIKENPDKILIPGSTEAICEDMKKITLEKIYTSLIKKIYRVSIEKPVAEKVKKAIENTFNVLGVVVPWKK